MRARILIIAYGNSLRSDDGIALRAAEALEGKFPAEQVEMMHVQQLVPELAASVAHSECVIFLDAAMAKSDAAKAGEILVRQVGRDKGNPSAGFYHAFSPAAVLGLAKQLYEATPHAYLVSMIGENYSHGESLSAAVASSLPEFVARAERLIRDYLRANPNS